MTMRTIKFRGKASHNGEWLYGDLINIHGEYHILGEDDMREDGHHVTQDSDRPTWVEPDTIGQFTCLYDKNGKEIYEGDIIRIPTKHGDDVFWIGYESSHIGAFCLCEDDDCNSRFVSIFGRNYDYEPFDCEVIGNIHDNPKLLEQ